MTAGQEFVRWIRPAGCVLFLVLAVAVGAVCLTAGRDPISDYEPAHDTAWYAQNPEEFCEELEEEVFPHLSGVRDWRILEDGRVEVTVQEGQLAVTRAALLRYFDEALFVFS